MNKILMALFSLGAIALLITLYIFRQGGMTTSPEGLAKLTSPILFQQACSQCHGKNGEGVKSLTPPLKGRGLPMAYVRLQIYKGSQKMPAFPFIKGETLDRLAKYVTELK
ncbi:MAG: cytochrome c [Nitrospinaceae bacterium]|jgi:mono/diheme cytochrome c family protein|nr:cytochrome c [Nitrospinaceae bacterium]MBT3434679.1 cytochrome c [Nitrospinaceae bacterium]MBT3821359.1 cytochrome c [Nitrospinaceae bacterium]MBT4095929.1 cytochrome c [Nitrospinaceae bacterium]MBT4430089.1 cytochrome c [Nitrospinaceae bacterium]